MTSCPGYLSVRQTIATDGNYEEYYVASIDRVTVQAAPFLITFNYPSVTLSTVSATVAEVVRALVCLS